MAQSLINELDKDSLLAANLPKLFDSYPKITDSKPSSWIVFSHGERVAKVHLNEICHAKMIYDGSNHWDELVTAVPKVDDVSIAYQRMLLSGPFKGMSHLISLNKQDGQFYFHCTDLDSWPANVLYNFCIATRVPIEHDYLLSKWTKLIEEGYDETLAFLLSWSVRGTKDGPRCFPSLGHFWFDSSVSWSNVIKGNFTTYVESYKKEPQDGSPCNVIWSKSQNYKLFETYSDKQISEFLGLAIEPPKMVPDHHPIVIKKKKFPEWHVQAADPVDVQHIQNIVQQQVQARIHANQFEQLQNIIDPLQQLPEEGMIQIDDDF